ncbi:hypothetical protein EUTSA_v10009162mg [Eutrema salsugineum]|uniref:Carboxypeptidase A inhibitor-like domain-containing protein n=1 Tax=Eutrema salsugineum TaxID=72664 RepID=V4KRG1_EUTSA|nr:hypothetical protein EUTSA_v10009162mg [Eutrema salsugineum]
MSESSSSFSSLTLLLIIFLLLLLSPSLSSSESKVHVLDRELLEIRQNSKPDKTNRKPKCCEMRTRSQCSAYPRCRWCRSDALDDLCFSKTEALRLPSQVFLWLDRFQN